MKTERERIIEIVDKMIEKNGLVDTRRLILNMKEESLKAKKNIESRGGELKNIPGHIEMADDMLAYVRDKALQIFLEKD
jgi:hypothetical protein